MEVGGGALIIGCARSENKFPQASPPSSALWMFNQRLFDFSHVRLFDNRSPGEDGSRSLSAPPRRPFRNAWVIPNYLLKMAQANAALWWDQSLKPRNRRAAAAAAAAENWFDENPGLISCVS